MSNLLIETSAIKTFLKTSSSKHSSGNFCPSSSSPFPKAPSLKQRSLKMFALWLFGKFKQLYPTLEGCHRFHFTHKSGLWTPLTSNLSNALLAVLKTGENGGWLTAVAHWHMRCLLRRINWQRHDQASEPSHTILAHTCLSILLLLDNEIDRETISQFPFAPYAAQHWVDHAQFGNVSSHIEGVMVRLFDLTKPHFAIWVWLYDIDRYWTEHMTTTHPTQPEAVPLYYASLCSFVGLTEHLIAGHSRDVN